jgi:nitroreductase
MQGVSKMHIVLDTIKKRRSIRKFKEAPLEEAALRDILEAGQYAPSGGNSQTCHFLVLQKPEAIGVLKELAKEEFAKMAYDDTTYKSLKNAILASQKGAYDFTYKAPVIVAVANREGYGNAMADASCAMANMMLAATALGIGSCWLNQLHWLSGNPRVRAYLLSIGLEEGETVCASLGLGLPDMAFAQPLARTGNKITYVK